MKKVKILRNVLHLSKVFKKDEVHELEDKDAKVLMDGEHAIEHKGEPAKPSTPTQPPKT